MNPSLRVTITKEGAGTGAGAGLGGAAGACAGIGAWVRAGAGAGVGAGAGANRLAANLHFCEISKSNLILVVVNLFFIL